MAASKGSSIVILGGGFGGLTAANELRRLLGKEHQITLVDRKPQFFMGLAKLWIMTGQRRYGEGVKDLKLLEAKGIKVLHAEVMRIDTLDDEVETSAGGLSFDYLVIALGAELTPDSVPGFSGGAHNLYTIDGATELRDGLQKFDSGKLVFLVSAVPFKCPGAPYEAAMLADGVLRRRGVRDKVDIQIFTPEPQPLPIAGPAVGAQVRALLSERAIGFNPGFKAREIDGKTKTVSFENGSMVEYDLLAAVPTHAAPRVVRGSGLAGPMGWIPVDKRTLQTAVPNVYAIGDVAMVMTANNLPLPKLGILAEEEAKIVSANIASRTLGSGTRSQFEGRGGCYLEVGDGRAVSVRAEFLAEPVPKIVLEAPSVEASEKKREFETFRLASWF